MTRVGVALRQQVFERANNHEQIEVRLLLELNQYPC
jgi:hypothetical protein